MPSIITHTLFAEDMLDLIDNQAMKDSILKYIDYFRIGSNGPDFLFYSHVIPKHIIYSNNISHIGHFFHNGHANDFYGCALDVIAKQKDAIIKEAMIVYVLGHLCHLALDSIAHPYIYYKTGRYEKQNASYHHRIEAHIDALMLQEKRQLTIKDYHPYEIVRYDENLLKVIARVYLHAIKEILNEDVKVYDIRCCLDSWHDTLKLFYDPNQIKYRSLYTIEQLIASPWLLSGYITPIQDTPLDILNRKKQIWKHPCDGKIESNESFMEIFARAKLKAKEYMDKAYDCIIGKSEKEALLALINDIDYDTGLNKHGEMLYFDIIYAGGNHETI